jgi:hypothetical protein
MIEGTGVLGYNSQIVANSGNRISNIHINAQTPPDVP